MKIKEIKAITPPYPFEAYTHVISPLSSQEGGGFLITFPIENITRNKIAGYVNRNQVFWLPLEPRIYLTISLVTRKRIAC